MEEPSEEPTSPLSKVTPIGSETSNFADDALPDKEPSRGEEALSPKSDGSVKLREVDEASSPLDESLPGRAASQRSLWTHAHRPHQPPSTYPLQHCGADDCHTPE